MMKKPSAPKAPRKPVASTAAAGSRKLVSKTGDPRCTLAASRWQKAIKAGQRVPRDVALELARCRNMNRRKRFQESRSARAAHLVHLRTTGQRDKAVEMIRADRELRRDRQSAAVLLRGLRGGNEASRTAARSARGNLSGNETTRGREILQSLESTVPRSTLRRSRRRALGITQQPRQRRNEQAASEPRKTPPASRVAINRDSERQSAYDRQHFYLLQTDRKNVAAGLRALRNVNSEGRQLARDIVKRRRDATNNNATDSPALLAGRFLREREVDLANRLQEARTQKRRGITQRVENQRFITPDEAQNTRQGVAGIRRQQRLTDVFKRAAGINSLGAVNRESRLRARENVEFIRAATTTTSVGTRSRSSRSGRNEYTQFRDKKRVAREERIAEETTRARRTAAAQQPDAEIRERSRQANRERARQRRQERRAAETAAADAQRQTEAREARRQGNQARVEFLQTLGRMDPNYRSWSRNYSDESLQQARTQAGDFGNYVTGSSYNATQRASHVTKAEKLGVRLVGNTPDEKWGHLVAISGLPKELAQHAEVEMSGGRIHIRLSHAEGGGFSRTLFRNGNDEIELHNNYFVPPTALREAGMATDFYARSITAARAAGVDKITVDGGGDFSSYRTNADGKLELREGYMNGYHVWPEYGFNANLPLSIKLGIRALDPQLANVETFNDAIFHADRSVRKKARKYWQENGNMRGFTLTIHDLNDSSMKAWQETFKHRRGIEFTANKAQSNNSRNGNYDVFN